MKAFIVIAILFSFFSKLNAQAYQLDSLYKVSQTNINDSLKFETWQEIASIEFYANEDKYEDAILEIKRLINGSKRRELIYVYYKGLSLRSQAKFSELKKLITPYINNKQYSTVKNYYFVNLLEANVYLEEDKISEAIYVYNKVYKKLSQQPFDSLDEQSKEQYQSLLNQMSIANNLKKNFKTSLALDLEAEKIYTKEDKGITLAIVYSNIGSNYIELKEYDKAQVYYQKAIDLVKEKQLHEISGINEALIAKLHFKTRKFDTAKVYIDNALELFDKHAVMAFPIKRLIITKGEIELALKNFSEAKKYCLESFENSSENDLELKKRACDCLSKTYKGLNDYKQAYHFAQQRINFSDSLNDYTLKSQAELLETNDKISQQKILDSLVFQKQELVIKDQNIQINYDKNIRLTLILAIISLIAISILVGVLYRRSKRHSIEINASLKEKEWMLKEIHHRVKNNFQVISSLLRIQSHSVDSNILEYHLTEIQKRISAMSIVHDNLYARDNFTEIELQKYYEELSLNVAKSSDIVLDNLELNVNANNLRINLERAVPLGLLSSEALTNAFKYGESEDGKYRIDVSIEEKGNDFILTISDKGKGIFKKPTDPTVGMELIEVLTEQLDGSIKFVNHNGLKIELKFPKQV